MQCFPPLCLVESRSLRMHTQNRSFQLPSRSQFAFPHPPWIGADQAASSSPIFERFCRVQLHVFCEAAQDERIDRLGYMGQFWRLSQAYQNPEWEIWI